MVKISETVYLKDFEREELAEISKKINEKRQKDGKKILKPSIIMHEIIKLGFIQIRKNHDES